MNAQEKWNETEFKIRQAEMRHAILGYGKFFISQTVRDMQGPSLLAQITARRHGKSAIPCIYKQYPLSEDEAFKK